MQRDTLSTTLHAIADPTRRMLLSMLMEGDACIKDLARPLSISLPAVTKHVRILEEAGLITKTRQAQWRTCHLHSEHLQEVALWLDPYRQLWEKRLDTLEQVVADLMDADQEEI